jgi:hypothetical protein
MQKLFVKTLMDHIMEATMIPKAQIERAVGPILSMFLANVLTETLRTDPHLSGRIEMICPEFPLKKTHNRQSTNMDWLMYHTTRDMLLFVELKTADTSVNDTQNAIYRERQHAVREQGGGFLLVDLETLRDASSESGKYQYLLDQRIAPFRGQINACKDVVLLYLVPESARSKVEGYADKVLSFGNLSATIPGPYAEEWKVIHDCLSGLDKVSRRTRNLAFQGEPTRQADLNYRDKCDFDVIVDLCEQKGDAILVGFSGGRNALENRSLADLQRRRFKWDLVKGGTGKKDRNNWIPGSTFAWVIQRKKARLGSMTPPPIAYKPVRSVNWSGNVKFDEMVAMCQEHGNNILIGFTGGRTAFANTPLEKLKIRGHYKWDYATSTAKRKAADWLTGGMVLELLRNYHGLRD